MLVRISPATAKYKATGQPAGGSPDYPTSSFPAPTNTYAIPDQPQQVLAPPVQTLQSHSVSGPYAPHIGSATSLYTGGSSSSMPSLSSGVSSSSSNLSSAISQDILKTQGVVDEVSAQSPYSNEPVNKSGPAVNGNVVNSITSAFASQVQGPLSSERYTVSEESWKHHAHARAILSNLIGPNGEQLSSSDPYNTTVFVGGLSPLIAEDTLRTFFAPFGEIHYVCPLFYSYILLV